MRKVYFRNTRSLTVFITKNMRLLLLVIVIFIGALLGCRIFADLSQSIKQQLLSFMNHDIAPDSLSDVAVITLSSTLKHAVLLAIMFLLGMTPYGSIFVLGTVLFFGFCVGVHECYYYESGGIGAILVYVLPRTVIASSSVIIACEQSLHLSCMISRQLLPFSAHCGSLWHDFKRYLLRYITCIALAFSSAACEVVIQLLL